MKVRAADIGAIIKKGTNLLIVEDDKIFEFKTDDRSVWIDGDVQEESLEQ